MSFGARVRKEVGQAYNQLIISDYGRIGPSPTQQGTFPDIFRVISGWYGTREEQLRLMNAFLTQTQVDANTAMFNIGHEMRIRMTPLVNQRIVFKLYRCNLRSAAMNPKLNATGVYVPPTIPFAAGSAGDANALPTSGNWGFFWQNLRQGSAPDVVASIPNDGVMTANGYGAGYAAPVQGSAFESLIAGYYHHQYSLSHIFPLMKKFLRTKCIKKGILLPGKASVVIDRPPFPKIMKPSTLVDNGTSNFSKHSYFYIMRAWCEPYDVGQIGHAPGTLGEAAWDDYPAAWSRPPAVVRLDSRRTLKFRSFGDSKPNYYYGDADTQFIAGNLSQFFDTGTPIVMDMTNGAKFNAAETRPVVQGTGQWVIDTVNPVLALN